MLPAEKTEQDSFFEDPEKGSTNSENGQESALIFSAAVAEGDTGAAESVCKRLLGFASLALFMFVLFMAILICYADRTNISVASLEMKREFNWTNVTQGEVMSGAHSRP